MSQLLAELRQVEKLLSCGWTQGSFARDENGHNIGVESKMAVCFCVVGACQRASMDIQNGRDTGWFTREAIRATTRAKDIYRWNDRENRTQEEVLAVVRKTIRRIEREAKKKACRE